MAKRRVKANPRTGFRASHAALLALGAYLLWRRKKGIGDFPEQVYDPNFGFMQPIESLPGFPVNPFSVTTPPPSPPKPPPVEQLAIERAVGPLVSREELIASGYTPPLPRSPADREGVSFIDLVTQSAAKAIRPLAVPDAPPLQQPPAEHVASMANLRRWRTLLPPSDPKYIPPDKLFEVTARELAERRAKRAARGLAPASGTTEPTSQSQLIQAHDAAQRAPVFADEEPELASSSVLPKKTNGTEAVEMVAQQHSVVPSIESLQRAETAEKMKWAREFYAPTAKPKPTFEIVQQKDTSSLSPAAKLYGGVPARADRIDFSIADPRVQAVAADAAAMVEGNLANMASKISGKYSGAGIVPVNEKGELTREGRAILALEGANNDLRASYRGAKKEVKKLADQKTALENQDYTLKEALKKTENAGAKQQIKEALQTIHTHLMDIDRQMDNIKKSKINFIEEGAASAVDRMKRQAQEEAVHRDQQMQRMTESEYARERADAATRAEYEKARELAETQMKSQYYVSGDKSYEEHVKELTKNILNTRREQMAIEAQKRAQEIGRQSAETMSKAAAQAAAAAIVPASASRAPSFAYGPVTSGPILVVKKSKTPEPSGLGPIGYGMTSSGQA